MPSQADTSVRIAWADDAPAIADVQLRAWRERYAGVLPPEVIDGWEVARFTDRWRHSLARPADARQRVLVALDRARVTGFVITTPASDPDCDPVADGQVDELTVDPGERGRGHGSRLLQAAADTLRADRFNRAVCWLSSTDDARRAFLTSTGWAPDGAHRELDLAGDGALRVKQVRLHTALA